MSSIMGFWDKRVKLCCLKKPNLKFSLNSDWIYNWCSCIYSWCFVHVVFVTLVFYVLPLSLTSINGKRRVFSSLSNNVCNCWIYDSMWLFLLIVGRYPDPFTTMAWSTQLLCLMILTHMMILSLLIRLRTPAFLWRTLLSR